MGWKYLGRVADDGRVTRVLIDPSRLDISALNVPLFVYNDDERCRLLAEKLRVVISVGGHCGTLSDDVLDSLMPCQRIGYLIGCHELPEVRNVAPVTPRAGLTPTYLTRSPGMYPCEFSLSNMLDPSPTSPECKCEGQTVL